jgi:uncharacterized protein YecE (DUF72 family)
MKFGKLPDIEGVDFSLPAQPDRNHLLLDDLPGQATTSFYIGCTGWSMKEWVGKVYPKGTKAADYLYHYSRQFNTIEFNTTHYRIPSVEMVDRWRINSPEDFRFCPKIPQTISHSRDLDAGNRNIDLFTERIRGLGSRLGCCFMQLPPYFDPTRLAVLEHFFGRFPTDIPLAIEVRHPAFFADPAAATAFFQLLEQYDRTAVITDVAGRRDVLHLRLTNQRTMIRFVGNGLHPTDYSRIDEWVELLKDWIAAGLSEIYFFPHEPDNILAPDLSVYLFQQLEKIPKLILRGPRLSNPRDGEQISLF